MGIRDKEQKRDENQKKSNPSDTQQVTTTRCTLKRFWGGSKVNYNIGNLHFWINSLKRAQPQNVVVTPLRALWLVKGKSLSDNAATKFVPHLYVVSL